MHTYKKITFFTIVLAAITIEVSGQVASLCRPNERFLSCGGCQKTCRDPTPACTAICREGCYCNDDEVRNDTGHCVKLAECPVLPAHYEKTTEPRSVDNQCPLNEEYKFCEPCNRTCDNPNPICPAQCNRGCFCKGDLVRNRQGKCVKYEECLPLHKNENSNYVDPIPYRFSCGPNQLYKECGSCDKTCSNLNPYCPAVCFTGCLCKEGFVRAPSGQCVRLEQCPKAAEMTLGLSVHEPSVEDCSADEEYLVCGWCEPSCSETSPLCPAACVTGCLCRPPLVRHHTGHCVEIKDCLPQKCKNPNEEFTCRYGCEKRCIALPCSQRPRRCTLGCHCILGFLRDENENCVTADQCRSETLKSQNL